MHQGLFTPLQLPRFRQLFAAQVLSDFGNWLEFIAITIMITYRWEMGPGALSAFFIAVCLPYVLFGPFLGVLADRFDRKVVMMASDLVRALILVGLMFTENLPMLLALMFVKGTLSTFFNSARQSAIRQIVPEDKLLQATSLSQTSVNLSKVIGPTIGASLLTMVELPVIYAIGALMYAGSALLLSRLPTLAAEKRASVRRLSVFAEFREGLDYIRSKKLLVIVITFFVVESLAMFSFEPQQSLLIEAAGFGEQVTGLLVSTTGLGSVVIAMLLGRYGKRYDPFTQLFLAAMLLGAALILLSLSAAGQLPSTLLSWFLLFFLLGLTIGAIGVNYGYLLQAHTPPNYMGRVAGTAESLVYLAILAAALFGGQLAEHLGVTALFLYAGIHMMLSGVWLRWATKKTPRSV